MKERKERDDFAQEKKWKEIPNLKNIALIPYFKQEFGIRTTEKKVISSSRLLSLYRKVSYTHIETK